MSASDLMIRRDPKDQVSDAIKLNNRHRTETLVHFRFSYCRTDSNQNLIFSEIGTKFS